MKPRQEKKGREKKRTKTMTDTTFAFIPRAARSAKPRKTGLTEIRGPYYSAYGPRHLADLLETMGTWVVESNMRAARSLSCRPKS
jgi:hypothetical protein